MQYFNDGNGNIYAYEDDVTITTASNGTTTGVAPNGSKLPNVPTDLTSYTPPTPTAAEKLANSQQAQIAQLTDAYQAAIQADIQYTSAGGTKQTYQADKASRDNLHDMLDGFSASKSVPSGFYWVAKDNTHVTFTYADLQGLAQALASRGAAAFAQLQTYKTSVRSAAKPADVQAITWGS